jgi:signal transduction histidine kinase
MIFDFRLLSLILFLAALLDFALILAIWRRRRAPGAIPFIIYLSSASIWVLGTAFEVGATNLNTIILFGKIEYLGVVTTGVLWLLFTLNFSGSSWWKRSALIIPLCLVPLFTLIMIWTNDSHGLIWSRVSFTTSQLGSIANWEHGKLFWLNPIYQYLLYLAGLVIMLRFGLIRPRRQLKQISALLCGTFIPFIGNIIYTTGSSPLKGFDFTTFCIFIGAIVYTITIFNLKFLNVIPVAYETLVHSIPEGILVLDEQDQVIETNSTASAFLRQKSSALIGLNLNKALSVLNIRIHTDGPSDPDEISKTSDRNTVHLLVKKVDLLNKRKQLIGKLVMLTDITDLTNTQHKLESLLNEERELRGKLEMEIQKRSQYTRAIVHELRTPLTSIIASSDLLEDQIKEKLNAALVKNVQRSALNMEKRVNELFELARGEMGLLTIEAVPMDMTVLIKQVVSEIQPVAANQGIALSADLPNSTLIVMGDQGRLRQVLINLLSNALKYTQQGQIIIKAVTDAGGVALIQVEDSGKGIQASEMGTLFNPYERTLNEKWKSSGLGIGLALCKIYIELHHGIIRAESQVGKGTTISFSLPLYKG